jgi:hypothetical protein
MRVSAQILTAELSLYTTSPTALFHHGKVETQTVYCTNLRPQSGCVDEDYEIRPYYPCLTTNTFAVGIK